MTWFRATNFYRITFALSATGAALSLLNNLTAPRVRPRDAVSMAPGERVVVCIPARNEQLTLPRLIADLRAQNIDCDISIFVLDDNSTDDTHAAAGAAIGRDERFTLVGPGGAEPSENSREVGKCLACIRLGDLALAGDPTALIFLDADVRLHPDALASSLAMLRQRGADLLSPWPHQDAVGPTERLVQPLLTWSWSSTLFVRGANAGTRASTALACGQFLVMDARAYRQVGGHRPVATSVLDDMTLARTFRTRGLSTMVAYAGEVASCRMYTDAEQVRQGYTRWLWSAFGPPALAPVVMAAATAVYVFPVIAIVTGSRQRRLAAGSLFAAWLSRLISRRSEGSTEPMVVDALTATTHPVSILAGAALIAESARGRRRGTLSWKGRRLAVD